MAPFPSVANEGEIASPALLLSSERIDANLRQMVEIAGDPARLWPHVKTHKLPQLVQRQVALGITKAKCATIAEAEMCAQAGARQVLLAQQPVGPNVERLLALQQAYPEVAFSTLVDDPGALRTLARAAVQADTTVLAFLDLDVGMHRTGIAIGPAAQELYRQLYTTAGLRAGGLHAYDGHLHQADPVERGAASTAIYLALTRFRLDLRLSGLPEPPTVIAGGTPTFPMHARRAGLELSPGTTVLYDAGYSSKVPDLPFIPAAALLTRVISKPAPDRLCLDLGHKAVASEMPHPRVLFPRLPEAKAVMHSEEHLVLETANAADFAVGDALYAIPWHICPTVNLHAEAWLIEGKRATQCWPIVGRARRLTV